MTARSMRQRIATTAILFAAVFAALALRAVHLTVLEGEALRQRADRQHEQEVPLSAERGPIVDRYGEPLALSRESAAVYVRPREWSAAPDTLRTVARLLELPQDVVLQRASASAPFVWLRRQVPLDRWSALEDMKLPGIGSEPARQRVYPHGALAGQVLGFTGVDGHGLEGVERALDAEMRGEVEAMVVGHDARGRQFVLGEEWGSLPRAGAQIELTLDAALQRFAEAELERAVHEQGARAGTLVALDPGTGEVLAMATVPRFDPNQFATASAEQWRNRAITDCYEPGSTFKAVLASAAIDAGVVRPSDRDRLRVRQVGGRQPRHSRFAPARRADVRGRHRAVEQHRLGQGRRAARQRTLRRRLAAIRVRDPDRHRPAGRSRRPAAPHRALGAHPPGDHRVRSRHRGYAAAAGARVCRDCQRRPADAPVCRSPHHQSGRHAALRRSPAQRGPGDVAPDGGDGDRPVGASHRNRHRETGAHRRLHRGGQDRHCAEGRSTHRPVQHA